MSHKGISSLADVEGRLAVGHTGQLTVRLGALEERPGPGDAGSLVQIHKTVRVGVNRCVDRHIANLGLEMAVVHKLPLEMGLASAVVDGQEVGVDVEAVGLLFITDVGTETDGSRGCVARRSSVRDGGGR